MMFPYVLAVINGILKPTVTGTAAMVTGTNNAIAYLLKLKEDAIKKTPSWQMFVGPSGDGDRDKWYKYTHPNGTGEGPLDGIGNEILQILFEAAALCINTLRTFYLIVLAILGPLVFGFAVFDGFQNTLHMWLARYINVFLWLPVANIFGSIIGKIQENMLRVDIQQVLRYGDTFFSATDTAYLIFLVIGIVGYFTVPSVAGYIVHAGGGNALLYKASNFFTGGSRTATTAVVAGAGAVLTSAATAMSGSGAQSSNANAMGTDHYMHKKLSGES
jgi:hypothetical protein